MKRMLVLVSLLAVTGLVLAAGEPKPGAGRTAAGADGKTAQAPAASEKEAGDQPATEAEPAGQDGAKAPPGEEAEAKENAGPKVISGMSILGNQEAPKSLVIVPWKSSELGASIGIMPMLDDSRTPIDKEVFMRALAYYQLRSAEGR